MRRSASSGATPTETRLRLGGVKVSKLSKMEKRRPFVNPSALLHPASTFALAFACVSYTSVSQTQSTNSTNHPASFAQLLKSLTNEANEAFRLIPGVF